jgi:hypothetical protein
VQAEEPGKRLGSALTIYSSTLQACHAIQVGNPDWSTRAFRLDPDDSAMAIRGAGPNFFLFAQWPSSGDWTKTK